MDLHPLLLAGLPAHKPLIYKLIKSTGFADAPTHAPAKRWLYADNTGIEKTTITVTLKTCEVPIASRLAILNIAAANSRDGESDVRERIQ